MWEFRLPTEVIFGDCVAASIMEAFARYCGFNTIDALVSGVRELKKAAGLPCTLSDAGIPAGAVDTLVEYSFHPLMKNNPVEVTPNDLRRMYEELA